MNGENQACNCPEIHKFKVRYIGDYYKIDFIKGEVYEAYNPIDCRPDRIYVIADRHGEEYGYPATEFEKLSEEEAKTAIIRDR